MKISKFIKLLTKKIEYNYACHGVQIKLEIKRYYPGYKHFIFRVLFKPGSKVNLFFTRAKDIGITLQVPLFRPFIEDTQLYLAVSFQSNIPNDLASLLDSKEFRNESEQLPVVIGRDLLFRPVIADVADMPHAFLAGSTNSGKSVGLRTMITSLIFCRSVEYLNLLIFDIGSDSLEPFYDIPHLSYPAVKDIGTATYVLHSLFCEMERRYSLRESERNKLPFIVCVFDEFLSFIDELKTIDKNEEIRKYISNLLRRGRKAKIHLILAAQDPTKKSMGVDIGNITTRMAFRCARYQTSVTIINQGGAETLSAKGAMLYVSDKHPSPLFVQGAFMPNEDILSLVNEINSNEHYCDKKFIIAPENHSTKSNADLIVVEKFPMAVKSPDFEFCDVLLWVLGHDTMSGEQIKKHFRIGNRVGKFMDRLTNLGIVSEKIDKLARKVIIQKPTDLSAEALSLLTANNFTECDISAAIAKRNKTVSTAVKAEIVTKVETTDLSL